jgi:hypothetical protein
MLLLPAMLLIAGLVASANSYPYNLEARYQFESITDSTTPDSSGNNHSLVLRNGAALVDTGHSGQGLYLAGVDDYAACGDAVSLGLVDEFTACAWVKLAGAGVVIARGDYISPFALIVNSSRTIGGAVNTSRSGDNRFSTTATITWNQWHHLALSYNAITCSSKIYIDGMVAAADTQRGTLSNSSTTPLRIGMRANGYYLKGVVDDARLYSRTLINEEVLAIFNNTELAADTVKPTTPGNLAAAALSPRMVRVSWAKATDNVKVTGYNVYRNGQYLATTHEDSTGWTALWLAPHTQYSFSVAAIDPARNESPLAAPVYAVTDSEISDQLYAGGWEINHEMNLITPACMETLRSKRILGYTKSFGGSMVRGYSRLKSANSPYSITAVDIGSPTPADFAAPKLIKADTTRYPYDFRVQTLGWEIRNWASPIIDAGFVFWHNMTASIYDPSINYDNVFYRYGAIFDSLQDAYPDIKFIYICTGVAGEAEAGWDWTNTVSMRFNEMMENQYRGRVPLYNMQSLLAIDSTGDTSGAYTPYANYDEAIKKELATYAHANDRVVKHDSTRVVNIPNSGLHPDAAGEKRMALGMTLVLAKTFCPECFHQTTAIQAPAKPGTITPAFRINANPSRGTFRVLSAAPVHTVWLYNAAGEQVAVLAAERGAVNWKAQRPALGSGIYFVSIDQGHSKVKLVLMK